MKVINTLAIAALVTSNTAMADDTAAIQAVIGKYEIVLNAGQTAEILELYSSEPVFMPQHATAQVGRAAVRQAYENVFNNIKLDVEFSIHDLEVLGDTAWVRTSSAGKTRILANNAVVNEGNNELFIFKLENGEWKIHQYLFSTNQPSQ